MVKPTLMPDTVNGYFLPRKTSTPCPPPTPMMNPPLVKITATWPVSARLGVATPTEPRNPSTAASITPVRYIFITLPLEFEPGPPRPGLHMQAGLLREDHREVAEHGEQNAGDRVCDREPDPRHRALDFHRGFPAWAGMR